MSNILQVELHNLIIHCSQLGYHLEHTDSNRQYEWKQLDDVAARGADAFISTYYKLMETQRGLLGRIYKDNAAILWNGNAFGTSQAFQSFIQTLPAVGGLFVVAFLLGCSSSSGYEIWHFLLYPLLEFEVGSYDSQAVVGPDHHDILITVSGLITIVFSMEMFFSLTDVIETQPLLRPANFPSFNLSPLNRKCKICWRFITIRILSSIFTDARPFEEGKLGHWIRFIQACLNWFSIIHLK